jgi:hypothetical protein
MIFLYALKAPATKDKYIQRLAKFLDSLSVLFRRVLPSYCTDMLSFKF